MSRILLLQIMLSLPAMAFNRYLYRFNAAGQFTIISPGNYPIRRVDIFYIQGRQVRTMTGINRNQGTISRENLPDGPSITRIDAGRTCTAKLILKQ